MQRTLAQGYASGPKSPGLIILEHELSNESVQAFMAGYPLMKQNNWTLVSVAELNGQSAYQNAASDTSPVTLVQLTAGGNGGAGLTTSTSTSTSTQSSTSTSDSHTPSASAQSGSGVKKNSASSKWHAPRRLTLSMAVLALVNGICAVL